MEEHDIDALIDMTYGDDHLYGSDEQGRVWLGPGYGPGLFAIRLQYDVIQIIYMNFKNNTNAKN